MTKRICVISPGHVSFNPRLVKEADALNAAGYSVHVIAANDLPHLRALDEAILTNAPWTYDLVGGHAASDKARRGVAKLARRIFAAGLRSRAVAEYGHHALTAELRAKACRSRADLYIAHYIAALPAAFHAASRHRALLGFDAEDFHQGQFAAHEQTSAEASIVRQIEAAYLPHATHFTAASPGIADAYACLLRRDTPVSILNVFPVENAPAAPSGRGAAAPGPSIYWFSQTIGTNRGLECAIVAISKARSRPHLYLRGNMQSGFLETLKQLAATANVWDRVHLLAPEGPKEMERLAAEYDLGLAGEPSHTENNDLALANKVFSYLLAGIPILATRTSAHAGLARICPAVTLYDSNPDDLASKIDSLLLDQEKLSRARAESWRLGQTEFNWDREQGKLLALVEREIGPP